MVKDQNPRDELADFDPEAPPEEPPDELAIERQRQRLYVGLLVLLVAILAVLTLRGCPRAKDPGNLTPTAWLPASPLVNLQGLEVTTLGPREGPYIVLDVPGPREVTLGNVNLPSQTCRLIGLSGGDGATEQELTSMTQVQRDAYRDRLQRMDAFRREAIREICGAKPHYILRMTAAGPDQPSQIYLLQPISETNTSADPRNPNGQAYLVNAWLLREGKANMILDAFQPFYNRMLDCQLAALVQTRRDREKSRQSDSLWMRFAPPMPLTDAMRARIQTIESYVR